ncbi:MAG: hypothetical protein ACREME_12645, partial [Gemmatimonadales bacterium]
AFTLVLIVWAPPTGQASAGRALAHVLLSVGASVGIAVLFLWLAWLRAEPAEITVQLGGALLLGAGFGAAAGLSPFFICALGAALIATFAPARRQVRAALDRAAFPVCAAFFVVAGAMLRLPTPWILAAAVAIAALRMLRLKPGPRLARAYPSGWRGASVAVALGVSFELAYGGSGAVVTTLLVALLLAEGGTGARRRHAWTAGPLTAEPPPAEVT